MTFTLFAIFLLIVIAAVIAWLLYELRLDKRDRDQYDYRVTVPGLRDRLPPVDL